MQWQLRRAKQKIGQENWYSKPLTSTWAFLLHSKFNRSRFSKPTNSWESNPNTSKLSQSEAIDQADENSATMKLSRANTKLQGTVYKTANFKNSLNTNSEKKIDNDSICEGFTTNQSGLENCLRIL